MVSFEAEGILGNAAVLLTNTEDVNQNTLTLFLYCRLTYVTIRSDHGDVAPVKPNV